MYNYLDINYSAAAAAQSMSQLANTAAAAGLQYVTNAKLAEKQYEYNLAMWNKINEYNSPAAQMKRFEEAGLNPNLIYGQGNNGNAGLLVKPAPAAPDIQGAADKLSKAFNVIGLLSAIEDVKGKKLQNELRDTANLTAKEVLAQNYQKTLESQAKNIADEYIGTFYDYDRQTGMLVRNGKSDANWFATGYGSDNPSWNQDNLSKLWRGIVTRTIHNYNAKSYLLDSRKRFIAPQIKLGEFGVEPWRLKTTWWLNTIGKGVDSATDLFKAFY